MAEQLGRKTADGILFTRSGSILLFREESPDRTSVQCCSRTGCSSKLSSLSNSGPQIDRKVKTAKAASGSSCAFSFRKYAQRGGNSKTPKEKLPKCPSAGGGENTERRRREDSRHGLFSRIKDRVRYTKRQPLSCDATLLRESNTRSVAQSQARNGTSSRMVAPNNANGDRDGNNAVQGVQASAVALFRRMAMGSMPDFDCTDNRITEDQHGYWHFNVTGNPEFLLPAARYMEYMLPDIHREMRMDIDGMSYEELLALGERIGTVSTGLSEDTLLRCVKRSHYMPRPTAVGSRSTNDGDVKCTICQEEYVAGDDLGKMECQHLYHSSCILQWLRQKNWCPVCKAGAGASRR